MNFKEAAEKLKEIANGEYHHLEYKLTMPNEGKTIQECTLYINPCIMVWTDNWEETFRKLERKINPPQPPSPDKQMPGEEIKK